MYTLLVCADLFGEKCNLEVTFPSIPTMSELQRKLLEVFSMESNMKRPQGYPPMEFTIARIQIYDDVLLKWADLVSPSQLHEYDQLYLFQPQNPWHIDTQKDLPPPRPPTQGSRAPSSMPYGHVGAGATPMGAAPAGYPGYRGHSTSSQPAYSSSPYTPAHAVTSANGSQRSPTSQRLEEHRRRTQSMQEELMRLQEETARLEREAAREEEEVRRREAEQFELYLREKEGEVQRQRESLARAEEEYRRLQEEKRRYIQYS